MRIKKWYDGWLVHWLWSWDSDRSAEPYFWVNQMNLKETDHRSEGLRRARVLVGHGTPRSQDSIGNSWKMVVIHLSRCHHHHHHYQHHNCHHYQPHPHHHHHHHHHQHHHQHHHDQHHPGSVTGSKMSAEHSWSCANCFQGDF